MKLFSEINPTLVNVLLFAVKIPVCSHRLNNFSLLIAKKRKKEKKRGKLEEMKYTQNAERQSALKKERVVPRKQYGGRR